MASAVAEGTKVGPGVAVEGVAPVAAEVAVRVAEGAAVAVGSGVVVGGNTVTTAPVTDTRSGSATPFESAQSRKSTRAAPGARPRTRNRATTPEPSCGGTPITVQP